MRRVATRLLMLALALDGRSAAETSTDSTAARGRASRPSATNEYVLPPIVVTARRHPTWSPGDMTVIEADQIKSTPGDDYGDLLRNVAGLNVAQFSARDLQVAGRAPAGALSMSELVLVDGRAVDLDGLVLWDFLPVSLDEVQRINVIRGPARAMLGNDAMAGVINVLTKSAREMAGTSVALGGGEYGTGYARATHAAARRRLGYKLSAGYYRQGPYERPTGRIPGTNTPYPRFQNSGTRQPKFDIRVDYEISPQSSWSVSGGYSGSDGILHTGFGPFAVETGSRIVYARTAYERRKTRFSAYTNILDGKAKNLLTSSDPGRPLILDFKTYTSAVDVTSSSAVGLHHALTCGASLAHTRIDRLSIAPGANDRIDLGAFLQDEILLGSKLRCILGGRIDQVDPVGTIASPRLSVIWSASPDHSLRVSCNQAVRAPRVTQSHMDVSIYNELRIARFFHVPFRSHAVGNSRLDAERLLSYDAGYAGKTGRFRLALGAYHTELRNAIGFVVAEYFSADDPPDAWPSGLPVPPHTLPKTFTFWNGGRITNRGVEMTLDLSLAESISTFLSYSFQAKPILTPHGGAFSAPPRHVANAGIRCGGRRTFAQGSLNYQDQAFWADVLDSRFWGPTDAFVQLNASAGLEFNSQLALSVWATNLLDAQVQQHIFGDILGRKIVGEVRLHY